MNDLNFVVRTPNGEPMWFGCELPNQGIEYAKKLSYEDAVEISNTIKDSYIVDLVSQNDFPIELQFCNSDGEWNVECFYKECLLEKAKTKMSKLKKYYTWYTWRLINVSNGEEY